MIRFLLLFFVNVGVVLAEMPADISGGKDHPLLSRYAGSWLIALEEKDFDEVAIPSGARAGDVTRVEGRVTRLYYLAPAGRSVLEVQRNYEMALEKAGATRRDGCAAEACATRNFSGVLGNLPRDRIAAADIEGWSADTLTDQWLYAGTERYWYGTLKTAGTVVHVVVLSARQGVQALNDKYTATVVQIVEPKPMDTGKVSVDAGAMKQSLQSEGKVAVYGIFFDTGKSEIKPESKPQLEQMAALLQNNPTLKVYVVGHTDNQGTLESNLQLSRARAEAVVGALVKTYKIDGKRLAPAGVASYAPVASNAQDSGRAKNRRVELVVQ